VFSLSFYLSPSFFPPLFIYVFLIFSVFLVPFLFIQSFSILFSFLIPLFMSFHYSSYHFFSGFVFFLIFLPSFSLFFAFLSLYYFLFSSFLQCRFLLNILSTVSVPYIQNRNRKWAVHRLVWRGVTKLTNGARSVYRAMRNGKLHYLTDLPVPLETRAIQTDRIKAIDTLTLLSLYHHAQHCFR
jgi:hypothetical protein